MTASDFENPRRSERWDEHTADNKPEGPGRPPDGWRQPAPEREEHGGYSSAYRNAGPARDDSPDPTHRFDPDYHEWRAEQMRQLDKDYALWRQERYRLFAEEFETWRRQRFSGEQRGMPSPRGGLVGPSYASASRSSAGFRGPPPGSANTPDAGASGVEPGALRPRPERSDRAEAADRADRADRSDRAGRSDMLERADRAADRADRTDRPDRPDRPEKGGGLLSGLLGTGPGRK